MNIMRLLASTALAGVAFSATATHAQTTEGVAPATGEQVLDQPGVAGTTTADGVPTESTTITVTGSRIRRPELIGLEPTTSISQEYYENRNITNVADALNELPQFRGSVTPNNTIGGFGNGVNFINTYGLGSNRTLTLINGRRVVSANVPSLFGAGAPGVQVDLNIIPTLLIERIDAVSIGGAPTYGSDAIAGTVNVILNTSFQGAQIRGTSGITERGDGFNYNVSGVVGSNFREDRGNVTLSAAYDKVQGIRGIQRSHIRDNIGSLNNCRGTGPAPDDGRINKNIGCNASATDGIPARILFPNLTSPFLSSGGVIFGSPYQFGPGGTLVPIGDGTALTGFFQSGGNTYQTSDQTQVSSNLRRFTLNAFGRYELTDGIELFAEGLYYNAEAREQGSNPTFNTFVFDPDTSGSLNYDTATTPFISESARQTLLAQGFDTINLSRSNEDLFDNGSISRSELKRGVFGARGDFTALGRALNYEVSFNYGVNEIRNLSTEINQQRFINAVSFAQGPNGPVCTTNPTIPVAPDQPVQPIADPRCVPLNLFGFGQSSAAARAYISQASEQRANLRQFVINANVGGNLFDLWSGPVGFNIGYEHRDEKASFTPDSFAQNGEGRGAAIPPTAGRFNLDEVFGEVLVPLVSPDNNIPFLYSADAFGRVRYVDNTVNGGFTAYAAGGKIALIRDIQFRGNYTRSFRAPAVTELFLPQSPTFVRPPDLCTAANIGSGSAPATRRANCTAFLNAVGADPATYTLLAAQASVAGLNGGNPNLTNEKADSYTFGAIIQPRFARGLTVTADYVDIKITGQIANLGLADIASGCFDNANFNTADPRNGNQFCTQLGFGPDGQIPNNQANPAVRSGFINGQQIKFNGITGTLDYVTQLNGIGLPGRVNVGGDLLYVRRRLVDNTGVAPQRSDGTVGDPEFSGQARFIYTDKNFGFGTFVNYVGKQLISRTNRGPSPNDFREFDSYNDYVTVDANVSLQTEDNFRFNVSVTNLTDRIGQKYFGYIIPGSVNDDIGRRFTVSVSKLF